MKTRKFILYILVIALGMLFVQCEGPPGPAGSDGTDGVDGDVTCMECHTDAIKMAIESLFMESIHYQSVLQYNGQPTYIYAGEGENRRHCAPCHTHEGFVEIQFTGRDTLVEALVGPSRIACETCHSTHQSFDFENDGQDYALRLTDPTTLMAGGDVVDLGGTSNACVFCHQPRTRWQDLDDGQGTTVNIPSPYTGPHHGNQSTVLLGMGGIEDGTAMEHEDLGCVGCHMGEAGEDIGGHSFWPNVANCTECHDGATGFDINGSQTALETKIATLKAELISIGILDVDDHGVPGDWDRAYFQAFWNYKLLQEDRSSGVHNPAYCMTVVDAALALVE